MTVFFVNNTNYGMTGGQMAPTTLPGQITTTTPYGRDVNTEGYPLKVCEMVDALEKPIYIERVALSTTANIMKARRAVGKALDNLKAHKGFSLVEVLSGCPVNLNIFRWAVSVTGRLKWRNLFRSMLRCMIRKRSNRFFFRAS